MALVHVRQREGLLVRHDSRRRQHLGPISHFSALFRTPSPQLAVVVGGCVYVEDEDIPSSIPSHFDTSNLTLLCSAADSSSHLNLFLKGPPKDGWLAAIFLLSVPSWAGEKGGTALRRTLFHSSTKLLPCLPTLNSIADHRRSDGGHQLSSYGVPCARHSPHT